MARMGDSIGRPGWLARKQKDLQDDAFNKQLIAMIPQFVGQVAGNALNKFLGKKISEPSDEERDYAQRVKNTELENQTGQVEAMQDRNRTEERLANAKIKQMFSEKPGLMSPAVQAENQRASNKEKQSAMQLAAQSGALEGASKEGINLGEELTAFTPRHTRPEQEGSLARLFARQGDVGRGQLKEPTVGAADFSKKKSLGSLFPGKLREGSFSATERAKRPLSEIMSQPPEDITTPMGLATKAATVYGKPGFGGYGTPTSVQTEQMRQNFAPYMERLKLSSALAKLSAQDRMRVASDIRGAKIGSLLSRFKDENDPFRQMLERAGEFSSDPGALDAFARAVESISGQAPEQRPAKKVSPNQSGQEQLSPSGQRISRDVAVEKARSLGWKNPEDYIKELKKRGFDVQ